MSLREICTPDRLILIPPGERIMREVAAKYHLTLAELRGYRRNPRHRYVPARVEAARRLTYELGYNRTRTGRVMGRDPSTISHLLGLITKRQVVLTPEYSILAALTRRQKQFLDAIGATWTTTDVIAESCGIPNDRQRYSKVSKVCWTLRRLGVIVRGGSSHRALWRRA